MKFHGKAAHRFASRPDPDCRFVLLFGDDEGLVTDTGNTLIAAWQATGPASTLSMDEDDIKRTPALLHDALQAVSLFGEVTIIRIRTRGEKLFGAVKQALELPPAHVAARLIVLANSLNKRSKLRTAFETAPHAAALHLFADSDTDIARRVEHFLSEQAIEIKSDALSLLTQALPGHRALANSEMEKLAVYAHNLGRAVAVSDIQTLCATHIEEQAYTAIILALDGKPDAAQAEMDRIIEAGLSPIALVRLFAAETARMLAAHALQAGRHGKPVGMKLKPPVWDSQWPVFQARLQKWPVPRLIHLCANLHDTEILIKGAGGSGISHTVARMLFIRFYRAAFTARSAVYKA